MHMAKTPRIRSSRRLVAPFLLAVAALVASAIGLGCLSAKSGSGGAPLGAYSVALLGDVHYDAPPVERFHAAGKAGPYRRNVAMWEKEVPAVLKASASLVDDDTSFALQLGDLIDGTSLGHEAHTQMLAEATAVLEKNYPGIPVISVCGNHDNVSGGSKVYKSFMVPWLARQTATLTTNAVTSTTFGFRHGPDLWIFINFNDADGTIPTVEKLLADNPDARYTFVAIHGPVLPMDVWQCRWFYLGGERQDNVRRRVRALFAKHNVIVLAGHVHSLEYKEWQGDGGRITEVVVNSVSRSSNNVLKPAVPKVLSETPSDYGAWLKTAPTNDANAKFEALYEEYRPGLKARYAASAYGHHVLRVSDKGVTLEYYGADATEPTKTFRLR